MREIGRVPGAMVEAGDDARERPGRVGRIVGDDGQIEGLKARGVAVGAERQRGDLRTKPLDRMSQHRPAGEREEPLVGPAHAPCTPAIQDEAEGQIRVGHRV